MAKNLTFAVGAQKFEAGINKVDRNKVYGYVVEEVYDTNNNICQIGNLLDDGQTLILNGATSLKTVDIENREVDKKNLKAVYMDGSDAVLVPSSFDVDIELQSTSLDDLFNLEVASVYQLTWEDANSKAELLKMLEGGNVFKFIFNYRSDYEGADAILLTAQNEIFALTGRILEFDYLQDKVTAPIEDAEVSTQEEDDDLDFGML